MRKKEAQSLEWDEYPARSFVTTRDMRGVSSGPFGLADGSLGGMNLSLDCGDSATAVVENRRRLLARLPNPPIWIQQVHGNKVHKIFQPENLLRVPTPYADAAVTNVPKTVLAILTADCLPVMFSDPKNGVIGVAHAGWKGLSSGILEATVEAMASKTNPTSIRSWLGPAISQAAFEVGSEVLAAFCDKDPESLTAFTSIPEKKNKWKANLYELARIRLIRLGITSIAGGGLCTFSDPEKFYSFRRDGVTGRMASLIWMDEAK